MGEAHSTALTGLLFTREQPRQMAHLGTDLRSLCITLPSLPLSPPLPHIHFTNTLQHLRARHRPRDCGSKGVDLEHPPQKSRQSAGEYYGHTNE